MIEDADIDRFVDYIRAHVDLDDLPDEYGYHSLPLCIIDSVFSINAKYASVRNVVKRYCIFAEITDAWPPHSHGRPVPRETQIGVSTLIGHLEAYGADAFTRDVFQNRQRTSTRNGILKGEAVYRFACALADQGIEHMQDLHASSNSVALESSIFAIPGQRSGISFKYFLMLAGRGDEVKPDRMIHRFLESALGQSWSGDPTDIIRGASDRLRIDHPRLTPRLLDNRIWMRQRSPG